MDTKCEKIFGADSYVCESCKGKPGKGPFCLPSFMKSVKALAPQKPQNGSIFYGDFFLS